MTSQNSQIQSLINTIDEVLSKSSPRLPWIMSGDAARQQQVLEQTRDYLMSLQQQTADRAPAAGYYAVDAEGGMAAGIAGTSLPQLTASPGESAQQVLQAVVQEMNYLRSNMMQPLREDIARLHQQREALLAEVKQLDSQRRQYGSGQPPADQQRIINDFLHTLMERLQEHMTQQVVQTLADLEARSMQERSLPGAAEASTQLPHLSAAERLEHIQMLQAKSDELMLKLDSTLGVVFESLRKNVESYQESLGQGLEKMYGLGQQGEVMFAALVNRLARQLGQEASSYLRSSLDNTEWELPGLSSVDEVNPILTDRTQSPSWRSSEAVPDEVPDDQIDQLLGQLSPSEAAQAGDRSTPLPSTTPSTTAPSDIPAGATAFAPGLTADVDNLDLALENLDLPTDLSFLDLPTDLDTDDELTVFQLDETEDTAQRDEHILSQDLPSEPTLASASSASPAVESDALDILNQITAELEEDFSLLEQELAVAPEERTPPQPSDSAETTLMGVAESAPPFAAEAASPENLYSEIDELYQNMFGEEVESGSAEPSPSETVAAPGLEAPPAAARLPEQSLENFLFDDELNLDLPDDSANVTGASDRLGVESLTQDTPAGDEPIETISRLTDLVVAGDSSSAPTLDTSEETEFTVPGLDDADFTEEGFIPASPDESLLVTDDGLDRPDLDVNLDEFALQQLTSDLSQLESSESATFPAFESDFEIDWNQADDVLYSLEEVDYPPEPEAFSEAIAPLDFPLASTADGSGAELAAEPGELAAEEPAEPSVEQPPIASQDIFAALTATGMPSPTDAFLLPDDDLFGPDMLTDSDAGGYEPEAGDTDEFTLSEFGRSLEEPTPVAESEMAQSASDRVDLFSDEVPDSSDDEETLVFGVAETPSPAQPSVEDLLTQQDMEAVAPLPDASAAEPPQTEATRPPATDPLAQYPTIEDVFSSTDDMSLEDLFSLTEDDVVPPIDEDRTAARGDAASGVEAAPPVSEETELTLDAFSESVAAPAAAPTEEALNLDTIFGSEEAETALPPSEADQFTLDHFAEAAATPAPDPALDAWVPQEEINEQEFGFPAIEGLDSLFEDLTRADATPSGSEFTDGQTLFDLMQASDSEEPPAWGANLSNYVAPSEPAASDLTPPPDEKKKNLADASAGLAHIFGESEAIAPSDLAPSETADLDWLEPDYPYLADAPTETDAEPGADMAATEQELFAAQPSPDLQAIPPDLAGTPERDRPLNWFLGIDVGTTGISAVLLNRPSGELHPVYWADLSSSNPATSTPEKQFRLPAIVSLASGSADASPSPLTADLAIEPDGNRPFIEQADEDYRRESRLLLQHFKPYLKIGIPHYSPQTSRWEPVLQWTDQHPVGLSQIYQALQLLLTTLTTARSPVASETTGLSCGAVGLDTTTFQTVLQELGGVIVGTPECWSDTYRFNVREAILGARLVAEPDQVTFLEDGIATILSGLRSADGQSIKLPGHLSQHHPIHNTQWQGYTLAINAGASTTELALVHVPESLHDLNYRDFTVRNFPYGGDGLDQDIICQLLYPPTYRSVRYLDTQDGTAFSWDEVSLSSFQLPAPGNPDLANRYQLRHRLESSPSGIKLLEMARMVKLALQQQSSINFSLGQDEWVIPQQELGSRVLVPYIQHLHRELIALLNQAGVTLQSIQQVICSGGSASLRIIPIWLRQKLPQATIIQDTQSGHGMSPGAELASSACSRVAYGLATLPLHPNVMELPRRRYSDYFLLLELLRSLPNQPLAVSSIMQILENRGIDPQMSYAQVIALLENQLPSGLVPDPVGYALLTPESRQNPDYRIMLAEPLFHKRDQQTYQPNIEQCHQVRRFLNTLTASTRQKLTTPVLADLTF